MSDEKNKKLPETVDEAVSQILDGMGEDDASMVIIKAVWKKLQESK